MTLRPSTRTGDLPTIRPLLAPMRLLLSVDSFVVFVAGVQLLLLATRTEQFFAWTIAPPITAAFLGAGYWASLPLVFVASRQTAWANARLAGPGILVFSALTLVATFMHLDRFHLQGSPYLTAQFAAWVWLIIYVLVPPLLLALMIMQARAPGIDPPRARPLPAWLRGMLLVEGAVLLGLGIYLFASPTSAPWPWELTPLTGRAVAAWLAGIGVIAAQAAWENDWGRVGAGLVAYGIFGVLQLVNLWRFQPAGGWGVAAVWLYAAFLISMVAVGIFALLTVLRGDNGP